MSGGIHEIENPRVGGSIPPPGTIRFNDLARFPMEHSWDTSLQNQATTRSTFYPKRSHSCQEDIRLSQAGDTRCQSAEAIAEGALRE